MNDRICKDSPESSRDRERSCKNCKHYYTTMKGWKATRGDCRIYPPKRDTWDGLDYWPKTGGSSFCGEYSSKAEEKKPIFNKETLTAEEAQRILDKLFSFFGRYTPPKEEPVKQYCPKCGYGRTFGISCRKDYVNYCTKCDTKHIISRV